MRNIDNKIKIPWYKRNIRSNNIDDANVNPLDIKFPKLPFTPSVHQPVTVPVTVPVTDPVNVPETETEIEPKNFLNPLPIPRKEPDTGNNPFRKPELQPMPVLPSVLDNNFDWSEHYKSLDLEPVVKPANPMVEGLTNILKPVVYLFAAKEIANRYVEANITDPVYSKMLQDPVLGAVLKEAEKANLDMETAANYFVNYDYSNFDANQMTKELTTLFGAAAAARLIVFFIGRKVLFKI